MSDELLDQVLESEDRHASRNLIRRMLGKPERWRPETSRGMIASVIADMDKLGSQDRREAIQTTSAQPARLRRRPQLRSRTDAE